jgi:hypothetical protein
MQRERLGSEAETRAADILEWYRTRWQIELVFKPLKSLVQLGHLPEHDDRSSRAWLHGKLLVSVLTLKLIRIGRDISAGDTGSRIEHPLSGWCEFSFALHQVQQAIEPNLSLKHTLLKWNGLA